MSVAKHKIGWLVAALLVGAIVAAVWWGVRRPAGMRDGDEEVYFQDVTAGSGVDFSYHNGEEADHYAILESLGGGLALIDHDGDGLLDLFVPGGGYFAGPDRKQIKGHPCKLYKNLGGWKFRDVTAEVGLGNIPFYTHGTAVADYDRDGWPDLLVTGYGRVALFRNEPGGRGGRRFVERTQQAGLLGGHFWATSAAWGDLDGDGFPELYICQYVDWSFDNHPRCEGTTPEVKRDVCPPKQFEARPHALYRNNGNGTFTEVSKEAGLYTQRSEGDYARLDHLDSEARKRLQAADRDREFGKGLGVLLVDVDGDGRPDIYVANDTTDNFLYLNQSSRGRLRFTDKALELGVARDRWGVPNGSMGVDAADYDGSGRASLLVTNYQNEDPALYRNISRAGEALFTDGTVEAGLGALGQRFVSFGTGFLDADNDGWEDLVIVNGHVLRHPTGAQVRQLPLLLRNEGGQGDGRPVRFIRVEGRAGGYFRVPQQGRGVATGDLDNDGRPDLVVSHVNAPVSLQRNIFPRRNHWLGIELADKSHRDVVGARLTLEVAGRCLTRFARGGGSYLSASDQRHLFGLGSATRVGQLRVHWPWGQVDTWEGLAVDRYWRVTAGERSAQDLPASR